MDVDWDILVDDNEFILNQAASCQNIPDVVRLIYKSEDSHKFYNVEINNCAVLIEYGGVGKNMTTDEKDFETYEEAKKFLDKKVISKIKSGYVLQENK
jgi:predicted DNA-binding WGR domain protein